jgi:hypothetical protein
MAKRGGVGVKESSSGKILRWRQRGRERERVAFGTSKWNRKAPYLCETVSYIFKAKCTNKYQTHKHVIVTAPMFPMIHSLFSVMLFSVLKTESNHTIQSIYGN